MIRRAIKEVVLWYWIAKCAWRMVSGRWFVFRDAPLWVIVRITMKGDPRMIPKYADNEKLHQFWDEAMGELEARRRRALVDLLVTRLEHTLGSES